MHFRVLLKNIFGNIFTDSGSLFNEVYDGEKKIKNVMQIARNSPLSVQYFLRPLYVTIFFFTFTWDPYYVLLGISPIPCTEPSLA